MSVPDFLQPYVSANWRLPWVKAIAAIAVLFTVAASFPLWISRRPYPLTALFEWLPELVYPFDYLWLLLLIALVVLSVLASKPRRYLIWFVLLSLAYSLFDISRIRPHVYLYWLLLAACALSAQRSSSASKQALVFCRLTIIAFYFWAGFHKFNYNFVFEFFPHEVLAHSPILTQFGLGVFLTSPVVSLIAASAEILTGLALLTRRLRPLGIFLAAMMLLTIALLRITTVPNLLIWNVALLALVVVLFWDTNMTARDLLFGARPATLTVVVFLFLVLPVSFITFDVYNYLALAIFSGQTERVNTLWVADSVAAQLPGVISHYMEPAVLKGRPGFTVAVQEWSYGTMRVNPYPAARALFSPLIYMCQFRSLPDDVYLALAGRPNYFSGQRTLREATCADINQ